MTILLIQVAICAGCNTVHPYAALIIGLIAGVAYMGWSIGMLKLRIDDPIDAVAGNSCYGSLVNALLLYNQLPTTKMSSGLGTKMAL